MTMQQVQQFRQVCGQSKYEGAVPICFLDVIGMRCLLLLVCNPAFRLSPIGLIHIGQTITQHGDLKTLLEKDFSVECRILEYRLVVRGVEADVEIRLLTSSNSCVWSGVTTLLSRTRVVQRRASDQFTSRQQSLDMKEISEKKVEIEAPADTGLKYAQVSGDWNPHHLFLWSARLLGYRLPIAHGLWTLARSISSVTGNKMFV